MRILQIHPAMAQAARIVRPRSIGMVVGPINVAGAAPRRLVVAAPITLQSITKNRRRNGPRSKRKATYQGCRAQGFGDRDQNHRRWNIFQAWYVAYQQRKY